MERDAHERWLQLSQEQQSVILAAAKEKGEPLSLPRMFHHTKLNLAARKSENESHWIFHILPWSKFEATY